MTRLLLLALVLGAPQGAPPSDELQEVLRTLREERAAAYARQRDRAAGVEDTRRAIDRLDAELAELRGREERTRRELGETRTELDRLEAELGPLRAALAGLSPALDAFQADALRFVQEGPDYRRADRLARLGPGGSAAERLGRAWGFLQEELRLARSGETYSAEIPLGEGLRKPARVFRLGHLLQGYVTEDGLHAGLETPSGWAPAPRGVEPAVRAAVEMLDRRRAPALLLLPVSP